MWQAVALWMDCDRQLHYEWIVTGNCTMDELWQAVALWMDCDRQLHYEWIVTGSCTIATMNGLCFTTLCWFEFVYIWFFYDLIGYVCFTVAVLYCIKNNGAPMTNSKDRHGWYRWSKGSVNTRKYLIAFVTPCGFIW